MILTGRDPHLAAWRTLTLSKSIFQLGSAAVLAIVLLRFMIGFHFYQEGVSKLRGKDYSSAAMLASSKGPLAATFQAFIWDADGRARLDEEASKVQMDEFHDRVVGVFGFDDEQQKQAERALTIRRRQLDAFFEDNRQEIAEYFKNLQRVESYQQNKNRTDVPSLAGQIDEIRSDLAAQRGPWLADIDRIWNGLRWDLDQIAKQANPMAEVGLELPGRRPLDSVTIDSALPYFLSIVGVCLILGLLTRLASLAGAVFLGSVIAMQFPGTPGAAPTYYQAVELLAMLVLAATAAGRYFGLDFIIRALRVRCFPPKGATNHATHA